MGEALSKAAIFVLEALHDDHESLDTLNGYFVQAEEEKATFSKGELVDALAKLNEQGYLQAYLCSDIEQRFQEAVFSVEDVEAYWFGLTQRGRKRLSELEKEAI